MDVEMPATNRLGSFYLAEDLRLSQEPTRLGDFLSACVEDGWYNNVVRYNATLFYDLLGFLMNATQTNYLFKEEPNWFDIEAFNLTYRFNLYLLNSSIFQGTMVLCLPPPPPTEPPMMSGGVHGWNNPGRYTTQTSNGRPCC